MTSANSRRALGRSASVSRTPFRIPSAWGTSRSASPARRRDARQIAPARRRGRTDAPPAPPPATASRPRSERRRGPTGRCGTTPPPHGPASHVAGPLVEVAVEHVVRAERQIDQPCPPHLPRHSASGLGHGGHADAEPRRHLLGEMPNRGRELAHLPRDHRKSRLGLPRAGRLDLLEAPGAELAGALPRSSLPPTHLRGLPFAGVRGQRDETGVERCPAQVVRPRSRLARFDQAGRHVRQTQRALGLVAVLAPFPVPENQTARKSFSPRRFHESPGPRAPALATVTTTAEDCTPGIRAASTTPGGRPPRAARPRGTLPAHAGTSRRTPPPEGARPVRPRGGPSADRPRKAIPRGGGRRCRPPWGGR